jgi:hypothetical protein
MPQRGVDRSEFRGVDLHQVANVVIAPVIMLMMWQQPLNTFHVDAIPAENHLISLIDLCFNGLLNQPNPAPT